MVRNGNPQTVVLVGAGLAGPLLSIYLARRGFRVEVYERRLDARKTGHPEGRSINLALSMRGIFALREVGLDREILSIAVPMKGRMMHPVSGERTFQPYGKDESEVIYSISRAELNTALLNAAERTGNVAFHFGQRCLGMDFREGTVLLRDEMTGKEYTLRADPVIGTDGTASALRLSMQNARSTESTEISLDYGYKELTIPSNPGGRFGMEANALHIWPRRTFMLIALPNQDGSFTCILFYPLKGKESFETLDTSERVRQFFMNQFPDAFAMMPSAVENFFVNPTGSMVTVYSYPWHVGGKVLLLGDSSHGIVPFFGQGMNCAFEDCIVLNELLDRQGSGWESIFAEFGRTRKPNTDAIAEMALENFVEMRDLVADPRFLLRKKVELEMERRFAGTFIPRYGMVTFHRIPYALARDRGKIQDTILEELCASVERVEDVDWKKAETLVRSKLDEPILPS